MQSNTRCFLPIRQAECAIQENWTSTQIARNILRNLLLFLFAFVFAITFIPELRASDLPDAGSYKDLDSRWLPWIGSWRMVSNTFNTTESKVKGQYLLTITPGGNGNSVTMKGFRDKEVLSGENIIADGAHHPLTGDKCTGWYMYSWSETGKRLLLNSESSCSGETPRRISGMSIIDDTGEWLDIQLLQNGKEKAVTIRRYMNTDNASTSPEGTNAANPILARISVGSNFSISEIIELSAKVEPEVLEAALLELHKPFPINSKQLERLADSKVPSEIVDIMVALSFPDKFTVERSNIAPIQSPMAQMGYPVVTDECWDEDYPFFPWYWGSSIYEPCDYWEMGWEARPGWYNYYWGRPNFGGGGHGIDGGKLVDGHGYARVQPNNPGSSPRYAQPRNAQSGQGRSSRSTSDSWSGMSSSGSSSGSLSGSSSGSSSKTPCASPSGYSKGDCD
jgi:hypothetical protein